MYSKQANVLAKEQMCCQHTEFFFLQQQLLLLSYSLLHSAFKWPWISYSRLVLEALVGHWKYTYLSIYLLISLCFSNENMGVYYSDSKCTPHKNADETKLVGCMLHWFVCMLQWIYLNGPCYSFISPFLLYLWNIIECILLEAAQR